MKHTIIIISQPCNIFVDIMHFENNKYKPLTERVHTLYRYTGSLYLDVFTSVRRLV